MNIAIIIAGIVGIFLGFLGLILGVTIYDKMIPPPIDYSFYPPITPVQGGDTTTRKDYEVIAAALAQTKPDPNKDDLYCIVPRERQWHRDIDTLCTNLLFDNPRFDVAKFKLACGWDDDGIEDA